MNDRYLLNAFEYKKRVYQYIHSRMNIDFYRYYFGGGILNVEDLGKALKNKIDSEEPFCAARFGTVEIRTLYEYLEVKNHKRMNFTEETLRLLTNNAGVFDADFNVACGFSELLLHLIPSIDYLGVWNSVPNQSFIIKQYMKSTRIADPKGLESYYSKSPWTMALEGKRVLVIHPFAEIIQCQYENRNEIWKNSMILPSFELRCIKAVQTIAGNKDNRFNNWFEALDYMTDLALSKDFDTAIIGCGAYGMPLAVRLRQAGKQAVHMGGATQILFGIRGRRWDDREDFKKFFNDAWVYPDETHKPSNYKSIENGCYW